MPDYIIIFLKNHGKHKANSIVLTPREIALKLIADGIASNDNTLIDHRLNEVKTYEA